MKLEKRSNEQKMNELDDETGKKKYELLSWNRNRMISLLHVLTEELDRLVMIPLAVATVD